MISGSYNQSEKKVMRNDEVSLGDALKNMLKASPKLERNLQKTKIENIWKAQMGETIHRYTREIRLVGDQLILSIESAALRNELSFGREKIKKIINDELGETVIREVIIR